MNKILMINRLKILLIIFSLLSLTACHLQADKEPQKYVPLPQVNSKYDEDKIVDFNNKITQGDTNQYEGLKISQKALLTKPEKLPQVLYYDSGINIPYPEDGVKGLYVTAENASNPEYLTNIINYINETELNALVIDFKDDHGNITPILESDNPLIQQNTLGKVDMKQVLKQLEEHQIYPIARIVTFKDNLLSDAHPEYSFHDPTTGQVWQNADGSRFSNPFLIEVWDYNIAIAIEAAKMGFKDIQFDYVRFPEGFDVFGGELEYDIGNYSYFVSEDPEQEGIERVIAINDYLTYAKNALMPYGTNLSADVFGYTAIASQAADVRGIGQNFSQMAERVDVISSMIYPSHWGVEFFGYLYPNLYPYEIVTAYLDHEAKLLDKVENNIISRPWLQDFTDGAASGPYMEYGAKEVQAQINALYEHGIHEYLLWNILGEYSPGVDYAPDIQAKVENDTVVQ